MGMCGMKGKIREEIKEGMMMGMGMMIGGCCCEQLLKVCFFGKRKKKKKKGVGVGER